MRVILVLVVALLATGCGQGAQDRAICRAPVTGGTAAQRSLVNSVVCASGTTGLRIRIRPAPGGLPKGTSELVIDAGVPAEPNASTGRRAARAAATRYVMSWVAAVVAGAARDRSVRLHLPHIMLYELRSDAPGRSPQLETQGRIALPGWGDPEGQGSTPPAGLGRGAPTFAALEQAITGLAEQTGAQVRLGGGRPLGMAPAIFIRSRDP